MTTALALVLASVMIVPFTAGLAAETDAPVITVSPRSGAAGTTATVQGTGLQTKTKMQLHWDGKPAGLPIVSVNRRGNFKTTIVIPAAPTEGDHVVAARASVAKGASTKNLVATTDELGSTTFAVSANEPTPDPTRDPTPDLPPRPRPPTAAPTATPTAAPTATPTAAPTAGRRPDRGSDGDPDRGSDGHPAPAAPTATPTAAPTAPRPPLRRRPRPRLRKSSCRYDAQGPDHDSPPPSRLPVVGPRPDPRHDDDPDQQRRWGPPQLQPDVGVEQ